MNNFNFVDIYKVNDIHQSSNLKHKLYPVDITHIDVAEKNLQCKLPKELKQFYLEIGYGFFWQKDKRSFDRLLSPLELVQINLREDFYEFDPDLEIYDEDNKLIFLEVNEGLYLTIEKEDIDGKNAIYYFDKKISNSLKGFLIEFDKNASLIDELEI